MALRIHLQPVGVALKEFIP